MESRHLLLILDWLSCLHLYIDWYDYQDVLSPWLIWDADSKAIYYMHHHKFVCLHSIHVHYFKWHDFAFMGRQNCRFQLECRKFLLEQAPLVIETLLFTKLNYTQVADQKDKPRCNDQLCVICIVDCLCFSDFIIHTESAWEAKYYCATSTQTVQWSSVH